MRTSNYVLLFAVIVLVGSLAAADHVGTVTAAGPLMVRGELVPHEAAHGMALTSGDEVETVDDPAMITLNGRGRVTVGPRSLVKILLTGNRMQVSLGRGTIRYGVTSTSDLSICASSRLIKPAAPSEGAVTIDGTGKVNATADRGSLNVDENAACGYDGLPSKRLTKNKAIVIVGTTAAAGAAVGIAKSQSGPPNPTGVSSK